MKLEVFDPAMCCSSGVCGPKVDPVLPRFAADLEWIKNQGIAVARYNLAQQPMAFAENELVKMLIGKDEKCLPLVLLDGRLVCSGKYPSRNDLAMYAGVKMPDAPATTEKQSGCCCGSKDSKCC